MICTEESNVLFGVIPDTQDRKELQLEENSVHWWLRDLSASSCRCSIKISHSKDVWTINFAKIKPVVNF